MDHAFGSPMSLAAKQKLLAYSLTRTSGGFGLLEEPAWSFLFKLHLGGALPSLDAMYDLADEIKKDMMDHVRSSYGIVCIKKDLEIDPFFQFFFFHIWYFFDSAA